MLQTLINFKEEKGANAPKLAITCSRANFREAGFASELRKRDVCCSDTGMLGQIPTERVSFKVAPQNAAQEESSCVCR